MGLNGFSLFQTYPSFFHSHLCRWGHSHGHVSFKGAIIAIRDHLNFNFRIDAQISFPLTSRQNDSTVSIGWMCLGTKGVCPTFDDGLECCQTFFCTGIDPFVLIEGPDLLLSLSKFNWNQVMFLEQPIIRQCVQILLVAT